MISLGSLPCSPLPFCLVEQLRPMQPADRAPDPKSGSSEDDDALCLQLVIIHITSPVKLHRSSLTWVHKDACMLMHVCTGEAAA